ncbi:MAG: NAD(P)-binding domain-containing protein [Planctomycetales bacterium]|nr:NAD(P)-binding domain-containing protein [Planctomycetales bacterium]
MALEVFLPRAPEPEFGRVLRESLRSDVDLRVGPDVPTPARYRVLVAGRPDLAHLEASPSLEALVIPFAGIPRETRDLVLRDFPRLAVHNLHHNAAPTAEMAMALLLAAAKRVLPGDAALRRGDWSPRYGEHPELLLEGRTVLVLGHGAVGSRVARACAGLGMRVLATRRAATAAERVGDAEVHPASALRSLLPRAHAVVVAVPDTPETDGLLGEAELSLLPAGAVLVNVGRGRVVDEGALFQALRAGRLSAGLDVWWRYPTGEETRTRTPPGDHPFRDLPNVVLSPHRAGLTDGTEALRGAALAELLNAAARWEPMPNRVDLARGY